MSGTVLQEQMTILTTEGRYDAVPYNIKEMAGFPPRYINLSTDQKELVETLILGEYKTEKELDIEEELGYIRDMTSEVSELSENILRRYGINK